MTRQRRSILAEKFADLGNFVAAALVFGQAVTEDQFSLLLGLAGSAVWALLTASTYLLLGDGQ